MKKKIGSKTTFQLTESQRDILYATAEQFEVSAAALVRGLIRINKLKAEKGGKN